ncbi:MAG: aminodeoxychorismate/anthranilate synthase component II [Planctomycetota bacterium]|nr:aminodeoxychorismate/anthranilate synthase component II [Planctomycetota bacterium]
MILLIDNYDSFVHNLARYFQRLGQETVVVRNDAIDVAAVRNLRPTALVLSPGPCAPLQAGCSIELVQELHGELAILGVCLGHQVIVEALGGAIVRAAEPMHGRVSQVFHSQQGLFAGIPNPMVACRYHSLLAIDENVPPELQVTARTSSGEIMAVEHTRCPVFGVQFHPESILTEHGYRLLGNFLKLAGLPTVDVANLMESELPPTVDRFSPPLRPVTF